MKSLLALVLILLSGCASTADIDTSKVETVCGQTCSANYSTCLSKFTLFPIHEQNVCTDAFRHCVQSCPVKKPE